MIIDLKKLDNVSGLGLLSGRENGIEAKNYYEAQKENITTETVVVVTGDDSFVVSNSYFLGLLEDFFKIHPSKQSLMEHLDYSQLSPINQKELIRGINRGYSSVINAMAF